MTIKMLGRLFWVFVGAFALVTGLFYVSSNSKQSITKADNPSCLTMTADNCLIGHYKCPGNILGQGCSQNATYYTVNGGNGTNAVPVGTNICFDNNYCGTQQVDRKCGDNPQDQVSTYQCNVPSPTPTPVGTGTCGTPCQQGGNSCAPGYTCQQLPVNWMCWNAGCNPPQSTPTPTPTHIPTPTPTRTPTPTPSPTSTPTPTPLPPICTLQVVPSSMNLVVGGPAQTLNVVVTPGNGASITGVAFGTSPSGVVSLNPGLDLQAPYATQVTPLKAGNATINITATASRNGQVANCVGSASVTIPGTTPTITPTPTSTTNPVCSLSVNPTTMNMVVGGPAQTLNVSVSAGGASVTGVTFAANPGGVVSLNPGLDTQAPYSTVVTPLTSGSTTINIGGTVAQNGQTASCVATASVTIGTVTPTPTRIPTPTPTVTTTPTPTPTVGTTPTPTPTTPPDTKLKICKYEDDNGDGVVNSGEDKLTWEFTYQVTGQDQKSVTAYWFNFLTSGCAIVDVPAGKQISVNEKDKSGWRFTGLYADGSKVSGPAYVYTSDVNQVKVLWCLNTFTPGETPAPTPTTTPTTTPTGTITPTATPVPGTPNSCGGTCGSNTNCQSGLFCYQGFCRNPFLVVNGQYVCEIAPTPTPGKTLGAVAPVSPKTGSSLIATTLGLLTIAGTGISLRRLSRKIW